MSERNRKQPAFRSCTFLKVCDPTDLAYSAMSMYKTVSVPWSRSPHVHLCDPASSDGQHSRNGANVREEVMRSVACEQLVRNVSVFNKLNIYSRCNQLISHRQQCTKQRGDGLSYTPLPDNHFLCTSASSQSAPILPRSLHATTPSLCHNARSLQQLAHLSCTTQQFLLHKQCCRHR